MSPAQPWVATCERFLGSVRRECLDHIVVLSERHLLAVLTEYVRYFNDARLHQALAQRVPVRTSIPHCDVTDR
jgi:transposase InsO family protein